MRVLVACERSGVVRRAFRERGHDAWSCDLEAADDGDAHHIKGCALAAAALGWDLMIAHPPCTYLSASGLHWNARNPTRTEKTEQGLIFVLALMNAGVPRWAIENPVSCISTRIGKPTQIIQPHQFGHDASKTTCLWLRDLPKLRPTSHVAPRMVDGKPRWGNQNDNGQNVLGQSKGRQCERSQTYEGIGRAMADQWGVKSS